MPQFYCTYKVALNADILHVVEKGGRGSAKSSTIAIIFILLIIRFPVNGVAIRYVADNLELSVYEQLKWAINFLDVSHLFYVTRSPMRLTYTPRGNYIAFRGGQNPDRIKSLKDSRFPFAIAWLEELAEFRSEQEVTTITNSLLRGELAPGLFYKFFYSYNPPERKQSWVNKKYETSFPPKNTHINHTTYLDNKYIAKEFVTEAEIARDTDKIRYDREYMGLPVGSGIEPFRNLTIKRGVITDEMVENFDNLRNGLDFGFAADPLAFVRWHYDKKRRKIYAVDELYERQMSNRKLAEQLHEKGYAYDDINADSAEPKSISELENDFSISNISGVKKGPDSVEYGEKWLGDLLEIVIDPDRTPNIAREFENIDYQIDKDGNPKSRLVDKDNHTIDATRYAFADDMTPSQDTASYAETYNYLYQ